jgi:hypothetical protein
MHYRLNKFIQLTEAWRTICLSAERFSQQKALINSRDNMHFGGASTPMEDTEM